MISTDANNGLLHHVFFWLKNSNDLTDREELITSLKKLSAIETVKFLHIGTIASTEKRDVVDNRWDVSELMLFENLEGQAIYQEHPLHKQFVAECSHLWAKVLVYDAMSI